MKKTEVGSLGVHDVGGKRNADVLEFTKNCVDIPSLYWEQQSHALLAILALKKLIVVDELRRCVENLPKSVYNSATYFGRWSRAYIAILLEKSIISEADIELYIFGKSLNSKEFNQPTEQNFKTGDKIRIKLEDFSTFWNRPHLRAPGYIHGVKGVVKSYLGMFNAPNVSAFWNRTVSKQPLYKVKFNQADVWSEYDQSSSDEIVLDVFQPWLEKFAENDNQPKQKKAKISKTGLINHGDHTHDNRIETEKNAVEKEGKPSVDELLTRGLVNLLDAKGLVSKEEVRKRVEANETEGGSISNGVKIVIKSWKDIDFKKRLEANANEAVKELGLEASNAHAFTKLVCLFNEEKVHNVIVCTLCSCYPSTLLGPSPSWYKERSYRSRLVVEPRKVLKAFGTTIPDDVKIIVQDSTADCRYMVVPCPPKNFKNMSDEELSKLITRDSLIGVHR